MNVRQLLLRLSSAFWAMPALITAGAVLLAFVAITIDRDLGSDLGIVYGGGPESARTILNVVASSVLTFAALTFSITMVALQLASSQFSPRVLRTLLRDRWTQSALGVFVGTFVFALLTLREVRGGQSSFVPGLAVSLSILLALTSIATLMGFLHHMAQSLRVVTIIDRIARETRKAVEAWYPDEHDPDRSAGTTVVAGAQCTVPAPDDGVLTWYNRDRLAGVADEHRLTVELLVPSGTWVVEGQPLLVVHGADEPPADLTAHLGVGRERETPHDPAYGFRQLVDIAEKALSPGLNDPTTAVQCLDRMHGLLRRLAVRELAVGDAVVDGVLRFRAPVPSWEDYLGLACNEVRHWGAESVRVRQRLGSMLEDLAGVVEGDRLRAVEDQRRRLEERPEEHVAEEVAAARQGGDPAERFDGRPPVSR